MRQKVNGSYDKIKCTECGDVFFRNFYPEPFICQECRNKPVEVKIKFKKRRRVGDR